MVIELFKTFFSLIKLNLIISFNKILYPKKKIIFFYQPNKRLNEESAYYIEDLFKNMEKNFLFFIIFNFPNVKGHNRYFVKQSLLKWIINVDLFLSNNVCDVFTNKSITIYMHHDIYDTPLIDTKKEKELFDRIIKYDLLFLPNKKSIIMFENFFNKFNLDTAKKIPKILEIGYPKLDYLKNNIKSNKSVNNSIVVAPTDYRHIERLSMFFCLQELIEILLTNTKSEVIFRPHPSNIKDKKILEIEQKFKNNRNFYLDKDNDYFDTYINSMCLITDFSGTAYTYAFFTKRPVIFFSKNEKLINSFEFKNLNYFKDREKIGFVAKDLNDIIKAITNIKHIANKIKVSNDLLEKEINYLGNSKNRIRELINQILIQKN